ncbi:hypothetical protein GH714_026361 [Hevea brasiliensis]|uniref:Uncharacterized protein n=1 Tax=Hevea brasiliensis TaxID=3981 RepID=A0A6A6N5X9_HEVBR|nr:hypothetical protein GH714_026361 [Hevea brasiliensis]
MASSSNPLSPPHFNGENYHVWAVKMRAYLRGLGVWQYVEENRVPPPLRQNPTLNQIRQHEDEVAKAPKALSYIHAAVSDSVFTRIMACESAHEAWMKLKTEFQGSDKTRQMQVFNLRKEFELLRMKDTDKVSEALEIREWRAAMEEELKMIKKNETWTLVPRPVYKQIHLVATKRVLRYIRATVDYGLFYKISTKVKLLGF